MVSVGGKVVEVIDCADRIWVNTVENVWRKGEWTSGTECAIYVERNCVSLKIKPGDSLWWQGRVAMWTAKPDGKEDVEIPRIGYSGVSRPDISTV